MSNLPEDMNFEITYLRIAGNGKLSQVNIFWCWTAWDFYLLPA